LPKTQIDWKIEGGMIVNPYSNTYEIITFENHLFDYLHVYKSNIDKWKTYIRRFNEVHMTSWSLYDNVVYILCKGGLNPMLMIFDIRKRKLVQI